MGKIGFSFWSVFLVVILSAPLSIAQDRREVVETLPSGAINWSQGTVTAKGSGAPPKGITNPAQARLMAERAAKADALRNLLETVKGVRVDSDTTVETFTTKSDRVMTRVSGIVIGARVVSTRYLSDGAVEITVAVNMTGELLAVMLQELPPLSLPAMPAPPPPLQPLPIPPKPSPGPPPGPKPVPPPPAPPAPPQPPAKVPSPQPPVQESKVPLPPPPPAPQTKVPSPAPATTETKVQPPPVTEPRGTPPPPIEPRAQTPDKPPARAEENLDLKKLDYTGLIIDARKLGLRPALVPKVLNEKGELVYSSHSVGQQEIIRMGLVGYAKDVNAAARNQRVTADPVVVSGLSATGEKKTDVVISNRDAQLILTTAPYTGYLKNGRVMVVYD
ncbi:MAG: LPP20 family lipoprotein [Syntrophaceae bacterium]|nr:LPP20 family lipoprotein [Syntrophaceae bacterium]